jgi:hypothetical protein
MDGADWNVGRLVLVHSPLCLADPSAFSFETSSLTLNLLGARPRQHQSSIRRRHHHKTFDGDNRCDPVFGEEGVVPLTH